MYNWYNVKVFLMPKIKIDGFLCNRCKNEWAPRKKGFKPVSCPKCKSPYWDKERVYTLKERLRASDGSGENGAA